MARILVVGAAGYIGSSTCVALLDAGHEVWGLDNFSTGNRELFHGHKLFFGNAGDQKLVQDICKEAKKAGSIDCVMHFAARNLVGESVLKPKEYYENNVLQTQKLLGTLVQEGIKNFIFSSTCAIFDHSGNKAIDEDTEKKPLSPYGENKLEVEKYLQTLAQDKNFKSIALRYFNAAGAEDRNRVGEWHENETHLIPRILKATLEGKPAEIYGTDYPTQDGTCIRDYIHVSDLAAAHILAMERLLNDKKSQNQGSFEAFNLGSEKGFSVREVIRCIGEVLQKEIKILEKPRRHGDAPSLVACAKKAKKELGWKPQKTNLNEMIHSAWAWEKKCSTIQRKAIFLDRDGTLNEDPGYLSHHSQMKLLPQVGEALALMKSMGYRLLIVSNQSGVARGLVNEKELGAIHETLDQLLFQWGVTIDKYLLCLHHPDEKCACRKPKPQLLFEGAKKLNLNLSQSYMVGDRISDIEAGRSAGCKKTFLVKTGNGSKSEKLLQTELIERGAVKSVSSLLDLANLIRDLENVNF